MNGRMNEWAITHEWMKSVFDKPTKWKYPTGVELIQLLKYPWFGLDFFLSGPNGHQFFFFFLIISSPINPAPKKTSLINFRPNFFPSQFYTQKLIFTKIFDLEIFFTQNFCPNKFFCFFSSYKCLKVNEMQLLLYRSLNS